MTKELNIDGRTSVGTPIEQVQVIVDSISKVIGVDVCCLYRLKNNHGMELVASHEPDYEGPVTIPAGKRLVGLVAKNWLPISIADASKHPDFFYIAETDEERCNGFCGVPLVRSVETMDALVAQSIITKAISKQSESFLVTPASPMALMLSSLSTNTTIPAFNHRVTGVKGAPGIGVGTAYFTAAEDLKNVPDKTCDNIEASVAEWHQLLDRVRNEITLEQQALSTELMANVAGIFDAYHMLLSDPTLVEKVEAEIRVGHWLPSALKLTIHYLAELFRATDDPYLKARHEDILHLGNKLFNAWSGGAAKTSDHALIEGAVILVGTQVSISQIASVPEEKLAGIICFEGSSLSHTAVVANAMGVPAVMGIGTVKALLNGDRLIVDGNEGQVILNPSDAIADEFRTLIDKEQKLLEKLDELRDQPAQTSDGQRIRLLANTGLAADIKLGFENGAEGIGLYRTEITFMARDSFPSEEEQVQAYKRAFSTYQNKPVYMRTLDIGGDKQLTYFPIDNEENPALGWRGIRFTLDNIQLLMIQVRAMIKAAQGADNLHIILPMISSIHELDTFRDLLNDACLQLQQEGHAFKRPKVGMMVEVPAAISQLPLWREKIDFVSIGSNDLSQYLLATDRNNAHVAGLFDHLHPAVLFEVKRIVDTAKQCNLPLSICGEMGSDPLAVVLLIGMGVRTLSMSAAKLPRIKALIRSVSSQQAEQLLQEALTANNSKDIRRLVSDELAVLGLITLL